LTRHDRLRNPPKRFTDQPPSLSSPVREYRANALRVCADSCTSSIGIVEPVIVSSPIVVLATSSCCRVVSSWGTVTAAVPGASAACHR
jgi:hypothetical protein